MKKLLGVSIAAMLAVTPMLASATKYPSTLTEPATATELSPAATTDTNPKYQAVTIGNDDQQHIASTAYVKGAYNSAIAAVNKVYDTATGAVSGAGGDGLTWNSTTSKLDVDLTSNGGLVVSSGTLGVNVGDGIKLGTNGEVEASLTSNGGLVTTGTAGSKTISVNAGDGLEVPSTGTGAGTVKVKLDGATLASGANGVKVNYGTGLTVGASGTADEGKLILDHTIQGATNTSTYSETGLTTQGYVDEKVATATTGMATQTGVVNTIASTTITVPVYRAWGSDDPTVQGTTNTITATIATPTYTTTAPSQGS